eukprot:m.78799 g.78799  ORF g.78799 m.78799 type:complete len:1811 (+) comp8585_c0_seq3:63-5495(+)
MGLFDVRRLVSFSVEKRRGKDGGSRRKTSKKSPVITHCCGRSTTTHTVAVTYANDSTLVFMLRKPSLSAHPIVRAVNWLSQADKELRAMCLNPTGDFVLITTTGGDLYVLPITGPILGLASGVEKSHPAFASTDMTHCGTFKQIKQNSTSVAWWETEDGHHYALVGTSYGIMHFFDLVAGEHLKSVQPTKGKAKATCITIMDKEPTELWAILQTDAWCSYILLEQVEDIGGSLVTQRLVDGDIDVKKACVGTRWANVGMVSQVQSERNGTITFVYQKPKESRFGNFSGASTQQWRGDYFHQRNHGMPLQSFFIPSQTTAAIGTDSILYLSYEEHGRTVIAIRSILLASSADQNSNLQATVLSKGEKVLYMTPLVSPIANGGCLFISNKGVYECCLSANPSIYCKALIRKNMNADAIAATFKLYLVDLYNEVAEEKFSKGDYVGSFEMYKQSCSDDIRDVLGKFTHEGEMELVAQLVHRALASSSRLTSTRRKALTSLLMYSLLFLKVKSTTVAGFFDVLPQSEIEGGSVGQLFKGNRGSPTSSAVSATIATVVATSSPTSQPAVNQSNVQPSSIQPVSTIARPYTLSARKGSFRDNNIREVLRSTRSSSFHNAGNYTTGNGYGMSDFDTGNRRNDVLHHYIKNNFDFNVTKTLSLFANHHLCDEYFITAHSQSVMADALGIASRWHLYPLTRTAIDFLIRNDYADLVCSAHQGQFLASLPLDDAVGILVGRTTKIYNAAKFIRSRIPLLSDASLLSLVNFFNPSRAAVAHYLMTGTSLVSYHHTPPQRTNSSFYRTNSTFSVASNPLSQSPTSIRPPSTQLGKQTRKSYGENALGYDDKNLVVHTYLKLLLEYNRRLRKRAQLKSKRDVMRSSPWFSKSNSTVWLDIIFGDTNSLHRATQGKVFVFPQQECNKWKCFCVKPTDSTLACGIQHSAVAVNGDLWTWGKSSGGRLGQGDISEEAGTALPMRVEMLSLLDVFVYSVVCGAEHTVVRTNKGIFSWGDNDMGQLGLGHVTKRMKPDNVVALNGVGVESISTGLFHTFALAGNEVWAWGANKMGQLGLGHTNDCSSPVKVPSWASINTVAIAAGAIHTVCLTVDGVMYSCGSGIFGQLLQLSCPSRQMQLKPVAIEKKVKLVACGPYSTAYVTVDDEVFVGGRSFFDNRPVPADVKGMKMQRNDGHYPCSTTPMQVQVPDGFGIIVEISVSHNHMLIRNKGGDIAAFGSGVGGVLGLGDDNDAGEFEAIQSLSGVVNIASGETFSVARDSDGTVWVWGRGDVGELGMKEVYGSVPSPEALGGIPVISQLDEKSPSLVHDMYTSSKKATPSPREWINMFDFSTQSTPFSGWCTPIALIRLNGLYHPTQMLQYCEDIGDFQSLALLHALLRNYSMSLKCSIKAFHQHMISLRGFENAFNPNPSMECFSSKISMEPMGTTIATTMSTSTTTSARPNSTNQRSQLSTVTSVSSLQDAMIEDSCLEKEVRLEEEFVNSLVLKFVAACEEGYSTTPSNDSSGNRVEHELKQILAVAGFFYEDVGLPIERFEMLLSTACVHYPNIIVEMVVQAQTFYERSEKSKTMTSTATADDKTRKYTQYSTQEKLQEQPIQNSSNGDTANDISDNYLSPFEETFEEIGSVKDFVRKSFHSKLEEDQDTRLCFLPPRLFLKLSPQFFLSKAIHSFELANESSLQKQSPSLQSLWKNIGVNVATPLPEHLQYIRVQHVLSSEADDYSKTIYFTCGHSYPVDDFVDKVLPQFVRRVEDISLDFKPWVSVVHALYMKDNPPLACPRCCFSQVRQQCLESEIFKGKNIEPLVVSTR